MLPKIQKVTETLGRLTETETIISTDLLQLGVLLCSIIIQQYTLQCTIRTVLLFYPCLQPNITSHYAAIYGVDGEVFHVIHHSLSFFAAISPRIFLAYFDLQLLQTLETQLSI